jgi:hypothetical protein
MSAEQCERRAAILSAVRSGVWGDELREHAASCSSCAEAAFVAHHLLCEAERLEELPMPDPRLVWRRAQIESRLDASRKATRLITIMQVVSVVCGGGAALALLGWLWPGIRFAASTFVDAGAAFAQPAAGAQPAMVLLASFTIIVILIVAEMWSAYRSLEF